MGDVLLAHRSVDLICPLADDGTNAVIVGGRFDDLHLEWDLREEASTLE